MIVSDFFRTHKWLYLTFLELTNDWLYLTLKYFYNPGTDVSDLNIFRNLEQFYLTEIFLYLRNDFILF